MLESEYVGFSLLDIDYPLVEVGLVSCILSFFLLLRFEILFRFGELVYLLNCLKPVFDNLVFYVVRHLGLFFNYRLDIRVKTAFLSLKRFRILKNCSLVGRRDFRN